MAPSDFHLLIDVGNTFLKWGFFRPAAGGRARENRLESGHALLEEIPALPAQWIRYPVPRRIVISNVAGTRVRAATIRALEARGHTLDLRKAPWGEAAAVGRLGTMWEGASDPRWEGRPAAP